MSATPSLPAVSWVRDLREDDRELLQSYGEFVSALPERELIREGNEQRYLFFVISGSLDVIRQDGGQARQVATIRSGESVGEVAVFDGRPASATVKPSEFTQLWQITRDELMTFIEDNPGAGNKLLTALVEILAVRLRNQDQLNE